MIQKPENKNWLLDLKVGSLLSYFKGSAEGGKEPYQVKTKNASIAVRGTAFYVETGMGKTDYFCPCHGQLKLKTKKTSELLKTENHDNPKFIDSSGKVQTSNKMRGGHADSEIESLKSLLK